jgi:DNA polymerase-4
VVDAAAFEAAGQALLEALLPVPKGIRLLGLGLHSMIEGDASEPQQLGLEI